MTTPDTTALDFVAPIVVSLNDDWAFTYTNAVDDPYTPTVPDDVAFTARMPMPAFWDDHLDRLRGEPFWSTATFNTEYRPIEFPLGTNPPDASLPFMTGVGWYRRTFEAPSTGRVTLHLGGVYLEAWVWLNRQLLKHHVGHSTGFDVPLDEAIRPGQPNTLYLAVANTRSDRTGCIIRGFKGRSGGTVGGASLRVSGPARIDQLYVRPADLADRLQWLAQVDLPTSHEGRTTLHWEIADPQTDRAIDRGQRRIEQGGELQWQSDASKLVPWSDQHPCLYELRVWVDSGSQVSDRRTQSFGYRRFARDGTRLLLNDKPIFLRGGTEHAYFPLTCTAPDDERFYREQITRMKALGFNWLRFHTWVPPEPYLRAADALGMLIQVEPPVNFSRREWLDILHACRTHPSVVIYCAGNEELLDEAKIESLAEAASLCHTHVPDALFNPQEALRGVEYGWDPRDLGTDAVNEPYLHNPGRLEALKQFSDCFGSYNWGLLSYRSAAGDWRTIDQRLEPYERPCLSHEITILGTYLDLGLETRYDDTRIGTDLYASARRNLERMGLRHRAARYYENSCHWVRSLRKHAVETARKCRRLAGYDMLGIIDYHWHRCGYTCGVANEFGELKPGETTDTIRQYNGESVLLLDRDRDWTFRAGETFRSHLLVSHYSTTPIRDAQVNWTLVDEDGKVHARGSFQGVSANCGEVTTWQAIEFEMPRIKSARAFKLLVRLESDAMVIDNHWPIWVYPPREASAALATPSAIKPWQTHWPELSAVDQATADGVTLVSDLDEHTLDVLGSGGRVILLGPGPFPSIETSFQPAVAGRAQGNVATYIEDHWITRQLPHAGFCDWQFYHLLEGGSAVVFNDLDLPFEPIIEVVSSYKLIFKQAALFELKVGAGRLVVCSLNVAPGNAASEHLLQTLIRYAHSDAFEPTVQADKTRIKAMLHRQHVHRASTGTDEGFDRRAQLERDK